MLRTISIEISGSALMRLIPAWNKERKILYQDADVVDVGVCSEKIGNLFPYKTLPLAFIQDAYLLLDSQQPQHLPPQPHQGTTLKNRNIKEDSV
jgi:hypothetical protein